MSGTGPRDLPFPAGHFAIKAPPLILIAVMLAGCAASSTTAPGTPTPTTAPGTPTPTTPPQLQVANAMNALAQSLDAVITGLIAARDQGKLPAADVTTAENVAKIIATTGKQIDAELKSADDWATQKKAIVKIIAQSGLQGAYQNLPANAQAYLAAAISVYDQIATAVGGPQL